MAAAQYYGTGRRKSAIARVYATSGTGKITINRKLSKTILVVKLTRWFRVNRLNVLTWKANSMSM